MRNNFEIKNSFLKVFPHSFFQTIVDLFKFLGELKKPLIEKITEAQNQKFQFEWKTPDLDQVNKNTIFSKELIVTQI